MNEQLTYQILLIVVFSFAFLVIISLFWITAPYGRHVRKGWGLAISARLGWLIMEFPAFFVIILLFILGDRKTNPVAIVFLILWTVHYTHRTFIYPFLMKGGKKKFPLLLVSFAITFNVINGYLNGRYLFHFSPAYSLGWFYDPRFIIGSILFFSGMAINLHSDHVLRNLRKSGETDYKVTGRGLFKFISCPNYFGEMIEWIGWAIATWSIAGLAFAVFTIANLMPRAFSNHKWYVENFPDYPRNRKAIFPFII